MNSKLIILHLLVLISFYFSSASAEGSHDVRCKCICTDYNKYKIPAKIYSKNVIHENCNCLNVAIPQLNITISNDDLETFCLHCECKYEIRSTGTMHVVVCIYLTIVFILVIYMIYLQIISPLISKCRGNQHELLENETELTSFSPRRESTSTRHRNSVIEKMSSVQMKWQRKVEKQRSSVFERREVLQ